MHLTGQLESQGLENIFTEICENRWSGTLHLRYELDGHEVFFLFFEGRLLTCQEGKGQENLAQELIHFDVVSVSALQTILTKCQDSDARLEDILIKDGYLSETALAQAYEKILAKRLSVYFDQRATLAGTYTFQSREGDSCDIAMPELALARDALFVSQGADVLNLLERIHLREEAPDESEFPFKFWELKGTPAVEENQDVPSSESRMSLSMELEPESLALPLEGEESGEISGHLALPPEGEASRNEDLFAEMAKDLGFGSETLEPLAKDEMSLLNELLGELNVPEQRPDIILLVLRYASSIFRRGVLFQVDAGQLKSVGEFGFEAEEDSDRLKKLRSLRILLSPEGTLARVLAQKKMFRGMLEDAGETQGKEKEFFDLLARPLPKEIFVAPIYSGPSILALIYADQGPDMMLEKSSTGLEIFLSQIGVSLEKKFLQDRLEELEQMRK